MTQRKPYKTYPKEFKLEAIRLMETSDRPASEIAMSLGIRRNLLYKWKAQMTQKGEVPSARRGRPKKENQSEMTTLRQENKRLQEENEIVKKAAAYFAQQPKSTAGMQEVRAHGRAKVEQCRSNCREQRRSSCREVRLYPGALYSIHTDAPVRDAGGLQ